MQATRVPQSDLATLMEVALDAIVLMDHNGLITGFNPAAERIFGYSAEEALQRPLVELLVPSAMREAHQEGLRRYLQTGITRILGQRLELEALHRDGYLIQVELAVTRLPGEPPLFLSYLRDISQRHQATTALRMSQAHLATLVSSLDCGVLLEDDHHRIILTNQTFCDFFGIDAPAESLVGQDCSQSAEQAKVLFADPERFVTGVATLLRQCTQVTHEELAFADGRILERDYIPILLEQAHLGHLWVYRDITNYKRTVSHLQRDRTHQATLSTISLQYLRDSNLVAAFERLLQSLLALTESDFGFLGEVLYTPTGERYIKAHALTDLSGDDTMHLLWESYAPEQEFHNLATLFGAVVTSQAAVLSNDPANDPRVGNLPPLQHFLGLPIFGGDTLIGVAGIANRPGGYTPSLITDLQPFLAACANILTSHRKEAARAEATRLLSEANHFISRINDTAPMLIYLYDLDQHRTLYTNRSIAELLGYSEAECETFAGREFTALLHPEDRMRLRTTFRQLRSAPMEQRQEFECRFRAPGGNWRWFHSSYTLFQCNASGYPRQILGAAVDVTERRQAENALKLLTDDLRNSNDALQQFASIASHDLKEPLRKIQAFGGRLKVKEADNLSPDGQDYLRRMLSAAERMQTLIDDLLNYSRVTSKAQPFVPVNLNTLILGVLSDLEARLIASGGMVCVDPLPEIEADPTQMRQLFQNLISNALKFARPAVPPRVQVCLAPGREGFLSLRIQDNGIGFAQEHAHRIFEVFERLHGVGTYEGTGMGLAICRRIVERHNGRLEAQGIPDQGATFLLELPLQQKGVTA